MGHDAWSCRCLEETEDDGEDWSNRTQRWLRISADNRRLAPEGQSAVSPEFHRMQAPRSGRRAGVASVGGGAGSHVSMLLYVTGGAARSSLVRAVRHSSSASRSRRRSSSTIVLLWLTSPWRGSPTPRRGPGPRWRTPLSTFQVYFVPHQDGTFSYLGENRHGHTGVWDVSTELDRRSGLSLFHDMILQSPWTLRRSNWSNS